MTLQAHILPTKPPLAHAVGEGKRRGEGLRLLNVFLAAALLLWACDDGPTRKDTQEADSQDLLETTDGFGDTSDVDPDWQLPPSGLYVDFVDGVFLIETTPFNWSVVPDDEAVLSRPRSDDTVPTLTLELGAARPFNEPTSAIDSPKQRWRAKSYLQDYEGGPLSLLLVDDLGPVGAQLLCRIEPTGEGLKIHLMADVPEGASRRLELAWTDDGGPLLGTGERFANVNQRGRQVALYKDLDALAPGGTNRVEVAVPLVINPQGYALLFDSPRPGVFDLGKQTPNILRARFDADDLVVHLWLNRSPDELFRDLRATIGAPKRPPSWALAPILVLDSLRGAEELLRLATDLRLLDVPAGGLWLTEEWQTAFNDFAVNPALISDLHAFTAELGDWGYDVVLSAGPYLDSSDDSDVGPGWGSAQGLFDEAEALGHLLELEGPEPQLFNWSPGRTGALVDLTDLGAQLWWSELVARPFEQGATGLRLTRGLDLLPRLALTEPLPFSDGSLLRDRPLSFADLTHSVAFDVLESQHAGEGLLIGEVGGARGQGSVSAMRAPGLVGDFSDASATSRGGLRAAVIAALSLSVSGYPMVAAEIGGETGTPDADLLLRWTAFAIFCPVMSFGPAALGALPWTPPLNAQVLADFQRLAMLRMQLLPYLELQLTKAVEEGTPILRPMALMKPQEPKAWEVNDQFYFGPDLIVAPILDAATTHRTVYLPPGEWRSWSDGRHEWGPTTVDVDADHGQVPMFGREGAIVPMQLPAETNRAVQHVEVVAPSAVRHFKVVGLGSAYVELPNLASLDLFYDAGTKTMDLAFVAGSAPGGYVEFLGVTPLSVVCDGSGLVNDESLALLDLTGEVFLAMRRLATGTLLRLGARATCTLSWP